ncbi:RNA polymerase sigma factor [Quadrisphaera setariae]|uniref:Sigma-70 family RNA polymerase sigma factor n=1 Tax=Quadrisphaera setariae TaxID=2593304 RepID=A0A5C8ZF05_9ACTN|nr:sigma-70 family RNA polymerase sigma factor [Quadrisphaera setariae]TXR56084.1 sigma-70 family RNA polymerase sigma factor [Quadrisphaera setariae]
MADSGVDDAQRRARFEALAGEVLEPLRRYLARRAGAAVADDAISDALLVLWRRLDDVPAPPEALPWAYGVARGCLANAERSARRQRLLAARVAVVDPPPQVTALHGEEGDDADRRDPGAVRVALAQLRPASAEVLRLWAWEELAPAQIAVVLGVTPNAVSIRLHRAKKELAEQLRKDGSGAGQVGAGGETR